jgi:hypothetical protein
VITKKRGTGVGGGWRKEKSCREEGGEEAVERLKRGKERKRQEETKEE